MKLSNEKKIIAIYLRVSSSSQDHRSQLPDLERYSSNCGDGTSATEVRWYRDKFSGKTMDRPGWNKLEEDLRRGLVERVVVWRLDRLGRTARGLTALFEEFVQRGVNLVSIRDGVDLSTPAGKLLANVMASVAQYETEVRAERVKAGQDAARAAGKSWGGSVKGRRVRVTEEKEEVVRKMREEGKGVATIARTVGLSRQTIYTVLGKLK